MLQVGGICFRVYYNLRNLCLFSSEMILAIRSHASIFLLFPPLNASFHLLQDVSNKLEERKDECLSQLKENDM